MKKGKEQCEYCKKYTKQLRVEPITYEGDTISLCKRCWHKHGSTYRDNIWYWKLFRKIARKFRRTNSDSDIDIWW